MSAAHLVIESQELNGAASPANCARNRAGPLIVFIIGVLPGTWPILAACLRNFCGTYRSAWKAIGLWRIGQCESADETQEKAKEKPPGSSCPGRPSCRQIR